MNINTNTVLITGGLGFIGSHIAIQFLNNNYNVIIIDNLSNSKINKLDIIKKYSTNNDKLQLYVFDLLDYNNLYETFNANKIDIVIHLAGLKAVSESINNPIMYYQNNLNSTLNLITVMEKFKCYNLIFSSSATVYGNSIVPFTEQTKTGYGITNPYGRSKFMQEEILKDLQMSNKLWNIIILRYFNPIGQLNYELKEDPNGIPNNLFPYIVKVFNRELHCLTIFGNDYNTEDGTCERDFINVVDLSDAHFVCSKQLLNSHIMGLKIYNVGTGNKVSVKQLINIFEKTNNTKLNYTFADRRTGDIESSYADASLIYNEINWKTKYTIEETVKLIL
jgi:UDP-glucose 4-epimerase